MITTGAMVSEQELHGLAKQLGECLLSNDMKLAAAESCTGGWLAKVITDIPGSSAWFTASVVSYSNVSKQNLLDVKAVTLADFGAVSGETVQEMSAGLFTHTDAEVVVSISGIAGPGGGSADKPVGLVWLSWGERGKSIVASSFHFDGDRESVRRQSVRQALTQLLELLNCR